MSPQLLTADGVVLVKKIFGIEVEHETLTDPDFSCIGEYTDEVGDWVIVRDEGEYLAVLRERSPKDGDGEPTYELPDRGHEFRFFKPYAGGEPEGSIDYRTYGKQDFARAEAYEKQQWVFIGIRAKATVGVSFNGGASFKLDTLTSGGVWGIESDSDKDYLDERGQEEMGDLQMILGAYGFTGEQIEEAVKGAKLP